MKNNIISALDEQFHIDCEVIETKYEYPQYTGIEKWIIITDLTIEELYSKYAEQIAPLRPFIVLSRSFGKVRDDYLRNEKKHYMRASRSIEPFDYTDELSPAFHPELISDNIEDAIIQKELTEKIRLILKSLDAKQKSRLIKFFFDGKSTRQIALEERTTHQAVSKSINNTLKKIKKLYF